MSFCSKNLGSYLIHQQFPMRIRRLLVALCMCLASASSTPEGGASEDTKGLLDSWRARPRLGEVANVVLPHVHGPLAVAKLGCSAQGLVKVRHNECKSNCHAMGASLVHIGSWGHIPGCPLVVSSNYKGKCHPNTNGGATWASEYTRPM